MAINVLAAAKHVGKISDWSLSHLYMQKLLYIAHMFYLGESRGDTPLPLVKGNFEAWIYGPVHPDLYHEAKIFGSDPVKNIFRSYRDLDEGPECKTLDKTYDALKDLSGAQLVGITHQPGGAWANNYTPGSRRVVIPNSDIVEEFLSYKGLG